MGFKKKIFLLAIIAALMGYIYYFNVAWDTTTIVFTVAIVIMCLIDVRLDTFKAPKSPKLKLILFAILATLAFYVWYFDVPLDKYVMALLATVVLLYVMCIFPVSSGPNPHGRPYYFL